MKWIPQEIETYLSAKEYVDTAVVPLYSLSFGDEMKQSAGMVEFITLLTSQLERQFTGRVLLFPPFTYLKTENNDQSLQDLLMWEQNLVSSEFEHIFYITSELEWRTHEQELAGSLIWLPSIPLEQMSDSQKLDLINSQVKQLLEIFTQKWSKNK